MNSIQRLAGILVCVLLLTLPVIPARATTWQVDPYGGGDFTTIQAAINYASPNDVINLSADHFVEQLVVTEDNLTIKGVGAGQTFIESPAQLMNYYTIGSYYFPVVMVTDCDGVSFSDLTLDGRDQGDSNSLFQGFGFFNAGGTLDHVDISGVRGAALNNIPHGNGVFVVSVDGLPHTFDMTDVQVADFQKSGIVVDGPGLSGALTRVAITGQGTTGVIAQNGIQVSRDAAFTLTECTVSDLSYTGNIWAATGFLGMTGTAVTMTGCGADACQTSVYMEDNSASFSDGAITNPIGDALIAASSGAKDLFDRRVPQPVEIAVTKTAHEKSAVTMSVTGSVFTGSDIADTWGPAAISAGQVTFNLSDCQVSHFERGFVIVENGGTVDGKARDCSFIDNIALAGWSNSAIDYDALQNWWGHISGPYHPVKNPGGSGGTVTDHILFDPWKMIGPGIIATLTGPDPIRCGVAKPVTVSYLTDPAATPVRGYDITFRITGPGSAALANVADAGDVGGIGLHDFHVTDNGDGTLTVSDALLGATPGLTVDADLFSIEVQTTGDGLVGVEFVDYKLRDLANQPLYAPLLGTSFNVDCIAPLPVTNITAFPGNNKVSVAWSHDDVDVDHYEVFRGLWYNGAVGVSAYPEYDDVSTGVPTRPATWVAANASPEWELVGTTAVGVHDLIDNGAFTSGRGVYYYEVFAVDAVYNGDAAAANARATNYWLGDVAVDGVVNVADMNLLGAAFGTTEAGGSPYSNILDVGPTDDWSRLGIPSTDNRIDFEDLMVFSMNFGVVSPSNKDMSPISSKVDLAWVTYEDGTMALRLVNGNGLKGLRVTAAQPVTRVTAGRLLDDQSELTFLKNVGTSLDASVTVMGVNNGFSGTGDLMVISAATPIQPENLKITARGIDNSTMTVNMDKVNDTATPRVFALNANYPNPFNPMTKISFSLPEAQNVELVIYSMDGKRVATLMNGQQGAGLHEVIWMGRDDSGKSVATGTYFYQIKAGPYSQVRKMTLIK